jgi:hypothetical protein
MGERPLHILASPAFLACLGVLLVNDFALKPQFHSALTGKLSDFAGLFVFPLFWTALFPRLRAHVYALTALAFALWKSPHSQPPIDAWNALPLFTVGRTVDPTDLFALITLPCSYLYGRTHVSSPGPPRAAMYTVALVSLFAFTATSYSQKTAYSNEYYFHYSGRELIKRMSALPANEPFSPFADADWGEFEVVFNSCTGRATIAVREEAGWTVVRLNEIDYRCPSEPKREEMRGYFEREFIDRLREDPVRRSSQAQYLYRVKPPVRPSGQPAASAASPSPQ